MMRIILIVDDANSARDIQNRLPRASYDVTAMTATADEVITRADELRPDVILVDVGLKGETDGVEVAQQIKSLHDIPIIFITANADEATVRRAIAAEPDGFLIMPLDALELRAAIEMAIHRHGMESKARESDCRIRELTESLSEVIFETDMAGNITFVNHAGLKEFGYTKEQVEGGMSLYDFVPPDKQEEIRESIAQAVIDEPSEWIEVPGLRRDGSTFLVSVRASVIVREGVPVGIRGIALNVTERKRAEQKLEESERRIREITDTLPVVVYEADETGRFTFANATAFDMFGYTKEELEAGMTVFQVVIDADKERARTVFRRRGSGDDVGRVEYTGLRKDGSTFPFSNRGAAIRRDGAVVGVRGIAVDITERKQAEERVKEHTHTIEILNHIMTEGNRATDVQSFAEAATKLACELLHFDIGGIYLFDTDARYATLRYAQGLPETARDAIEKIPYRDAPYNAILIDGDPLFAEDYVTFLPQHSPLGVASLASVPLYSQNTIIGALNVGSATRHTFSQAERELLIAIGSEVGTVIAKLRADAVLKESERRIRELTDALPVLVYEADATGRVTFANATSFDLFGYTKEELEAGMSVFELVTDADKGRADTAFRRREGGEDVGRMEYIGLRKDGSTFPVSALGAAIRRDGAVVGVRGIAIDITERKRDEQKLRESDRRIRELTDALPVVVYETDETGRLTFVNATAFDMFGYTKEELEAGMTVFQLIAPADRERARTVFRRRMSAEDVDRVEYTGLRKDGSTFRTSIRAVIMRQDAAVVGLRGIIVDITERKQTEEALAWESAINLAIAHLYTPLIAPTSTLEDIALAILDEAKHLTGSEHGLVSLIDPVNKDMIAFGLTQMMPSERAIPEEKRQIRFPIDADGSYPALWGHALNTKESFYTNAPATHPASRGTPDGHTPLAQFLAAPALVGEEVVGQIALANPGRDYTERDLTAVERLADVYALAVIRTQEEDAIKSALEERETLLKEIHHRVKNNMQIISSLLNLQAAQAKEPETVDMLNESQSRIRSMALIHEQLYRSSSLADIDFAEYVESLTNALLRMYNVTEGEIAITTDIENVQLGVDTAIPCALIVNELVSNCLKHAFTDSETGEVTIAIHRINGTYELTVADNGVGLPPDLDLRETNTLGLQLVTGLVNQLGGTITLDRTKGTTFIITFKPEGARVGESERE